jgi:hypothetical protein
MMKRMKDRASIGGYLTGTVEVNGSGGEAQVLLAA